MWAEWGIECFVENSEGALKAKVIEKKLWELFLKKLLAPFLLHR